MPLTTHTLDLGSRRREYLAYLPAAFADRPALPAVVFLHGAGATAGWALEETGWPATADREGFLVIAPEGTRADPSQPPGFLRNPQVWNDGGPTAATSADDVRFVADLLDDVALRYPVDPDRVFLTGFSNGGGMVFRLGGELSERFAALAPVAGHCWQEAPRPAVPRPTFYLVGVADPLVPVLGGPVPDPWGGGPYYRPPVVRTLERWADALGCDRGCFTLPDPAPGVSVCENIHEPGRPTLRSALIEGLGHHWPGGGSRLSQRLFGPPRPDVPGNDLIWGFFRSHC
jgi:polyhydroxybutyrate depolymerase